MFYCIYKKQKKKIVRLDLHRGYWHDHTILQLFFVFVLKYEIFITEDAMRAKYRFMFQFHTDKKRKNCFNFLQIRTNPFFCRRYIE